MHRSFLFAKLAEGAKAFDALATGTFTDMRGREITISEADLAEIVENTKAAIESATTDSGELVGLPIDADGHDHKGGAGWIQGVELVGNKIRIIPNWTEEGTRLIGDNIRRFFSASIDLANKVISGGSLTNWPATREAGKMLLRPIELCEDLSAYDPAELSTKMPAWVPDFVEDLINTISHKNAGDDNDDTEGEDMPTLAELAKTDEGKVELSALVDTQVKLQLAAAVADAERDAGILEFAEQVTEGEDVVLPIEKGRVQAFLDKLPAEMLEEAQAILLDIMEAGTLDFSEKGHNKRKHGAAELSDEMKGVLSEYLEKKEGNTIAKFFKINAAELGVAADYNLAEFQPEEK